MMYDAAFYGLMALCLIAAVAGYIEVRLHLAVVAIEARIAKLEAGESPEECMRKGPPS